jgi:adenosine deaminase
MEHGLLGLDLAGNEAEFSAEPFLGVFKEAHQAGLKITVHAGEWGGAANVREALEVLNADRIGHGVRVMEDPETVKLARERATPFEVCVTSNHQTGVVKTLKAHPLMKMIESGLYVTLGTDDPSISQITLSDEYRCVSKELGMQPADLHARIRAAAQASFLPPARKTKLMAELEQQLPGK